MNRFIKNECDASMRVFLTMLYLIKNPASVSEIIDYLKEIDPYNKVYTPEVILKYINTLRYFGINITKDKDKYVILNYPPYISLNEKEIRGLKIIAETDFADKKSVKECQDFIFNIERKLSDKTKINIEYLRNTKVDNPYFEKNKNLISEIEEYITDGQLIKLGTKDGMVYKAKPVEVRFRGKNKIFFTIYIQQKGKKLDIEIGEIDYIEQLPLMASKCNVNASVTYRLSGKLAGNYTLREEERVLRIEDDNSVVILNTEEAENSLLKRLIRYENLCEVLSPIETRIKMKKMIDDTLKLYNE